MSSYKVNRGFLGQDFYQASVYLVTFATCGTYPPPKKAEETEAKVLQWGSMCFAPRQFVDISIYVTKLKRAVFP